MDGRREVRANPGYAIDARSGFRRPTDSRGIDFNLYARLGAGGLVAVQELIRSGPDGYTMLIDVSQYAILPAMRPGVYDPLKDLQAIGQATTNAVLMKER